MARILIIDDDPNLGEVLAFALTEQGHEVECARSGETGMTTAETFRPEVLITDLKMPGGIGGMEVLQRSLAADPTCPVIILTAYGTIEDAVEAMRLGASDYLTKPVDTSRLKTILSHVRRTCDLKEEVSNLRDKLRNLGHFGPLLGSSPAMQKVYEQIQKVAPTEEFLSEYFTRIARMRNGVAVGLSEPDSGRRISLKKLSGVQTPRLCRSARCNI